MEISTEQETRPRPYLHLPLAPGRLPYTLGAADQQGVDSEPADCGEERYQTCDAKESS